MFFVLTLGIQILNYLVGSCINSPRSKRSCSKEELPNDFPQTGRAKVGARDWGNACKKTPYFWKTPNFSWHALIDVLLTN